MERPKFLQLRKCLWGALAVGGMAFPPLTFADSASVLHLSQLPVLSNSSLAGICGKGEQIDGPSAITGHPGVVLWDEVVQPRKGLPEVNMDGGLGNQQFSAVTVGR
ncbi:hypothetical protein GL267_010435 [Acidithiobacillus ferrianus]|uniref:Uncharacterized protein n=2 Tax=Acidithiobacillus ferrianus TaxID=2678518 RepID=A0A845UH98_9PROT|nr:hypothetical protein [Acidithiobacillus ferrianus]NDU43224.1 hypothetical protein [Acidithiobacillus ferrianus]